MRMVVQDHPLIGKRVDFDWRAAKEKLSPYDEENRNVDRELLVESVKVDCYGVEWCYLENRTIPQAASRVCKIY